MSDVELAVLVGRIALHVMEQLRLHNAATTYPAALSAVREMLVRLGVVNVE